LFFSDFSPNWVRAQTGGGEGGEGGLDANVTPMKSAELIGMIVVSALLALVVVALAAWLS
jgi:hypothetical protein